MLYEENCQLEFGTNSHALNSNDIMFAYEPEDGEQFSENEANYHSYQENKNLAYPTKQKAVQESLGFKHRGGSNGLPDYFGDADPKPIEISNAKGGLKKSAS